MNKTLEQWNQWVDRHSDVFFDLIRMYLGVALFFKATYFMSNRDYLMQLTNQILADRQDSLWFGPALLAHVVMGAHFAGGILLAFGLFTRLAALVQVPILIGAVLFVHLQRTLAVEPRQNLELSMLVLFLLVVIALRGAGRWSLDSYLSKKLIAQTESPEQTEAQNA